jgi:hypothetical protein
MPPPFAYPSALLLFDMRRVKVRSHLLMAANHLSEFTRRSQNNVGFDKVGELKHQNWSTARAALL